jgi:hypothetical protein
MSTDGGQKSSLRNAWDKVSNGDLVGLMKEEPLLALTGLGAALLGFYIIKSIFFGGAGMLKTGLGLSAGAAALGFVVPKATEFLKEHLGVDIGEKAGELLKGIMGGDVPTHPALEGPHNG